MFTNSNAGIAAVMHQEGRFSAVGAKKIFDQRRELEIPLVNDLNLHQILQLREEAYRAFPLFREKISHHLTENSNTGNYLDAINDLKYESKQVANELDIISKNQILYGKDHFH